MVTKIITDGSYNFYVTDHLGNVRAVTDASGTIEKTFDYYPFGESYESVASANTGHDSRPAPVRSYHPYLAAWKHRMHRWPILASRGNENDTWRGRCRKVMF